MIFWIVIAIGFLLTVLITALLSTDEGWSGFRWGLYAGLLLTAAMATIPVLIGLVVASTHIDGVTKEVHKVANLQDNFGTTGRISGGGFIAFSISGSFNGHLTYSWYEREPDGSYQSHSLRENNNVKIFQTSSKAHPKVIETRTTTCEEDPGWLTPFDCHNRSTDTQWELYVPRGTIVHNYKLDAK